MTTYHVSDILGTKDAILRSFGVQVFEHIEKHLEKGEPITLSFSGMNTVNFPFLTSLIATAYSSFPNEASTLVLFDGIDNPDWQEDLNEAIYLAAHPDEAKSWNSSMEFLQN